MPDTGLDAIIRSHLARYFAAHGDSLPPPGLYYRMLAMLEAPLIEEALLATRGNQCKAAEILGLNRNTLHKKMQQYGLAKARPMRPSLRGNARRRPHGK